MQQIIPHFQYHAKCISSKNLCCIKADGQAIHEISDYGELDKFYRVFGYTADKPKAGILPDEFIWDEYIKDNPVAYTDCLQIHIIEYLIKHSDTFRKRYGEQCESWIAAHAESVTARGVLCVTCRMKPYCSKRKTTSNPKQNADADLSNASRSLE